MLSLYVPFVFPFSLRCLDNAAIPCKQGLLFVWFTLVIRVGSPSEDTE